MPGWLAQWSNFVLALIFSVVIVGIVLSLLFEKVKSAIFGRALGSLLAAVNSRTRELEAATKVKERRAQQRQEQEQSVRHAVDELTESLTLWVHSKEYAYTTSAEELRVSNAKITANRALTVLQREGPSQIEPTVERLRTALATGEQFSLTFVNSQVGTINRLVREWIDSNKAPEGS
jgi:hypothetical protein